MQRSSQLDLPGMELLSIGCVFSTAHVAGAPFQSALEPLLIASKVDVMMTGHEHGYERIHPTINGTVVSHPEAVPVPQQPQGSAGSPRASVAQVYRTPGAPLGLMVGSAGGLQEDHWVTPQPPWSAFRAYRYTQYTPHSTLLQLSIHGCQCRFLRHCLCCGFRRHGNSCEALGWIRNHIFSPHHKLIPGVLLTECC